MRSFTETAAAELFSYQVPSLFFTTPVTGQVASPIPALRFSLIPASHSFRSDP